MVKALDFGHEQIKTLVKLQKDLQAKVGKPKIAAVKAERNEALYKEVAAAYAEKLFAALTMKVKIESYKTIDALKKEAVAQFAADKPELKKDVVACFDDAEGDPLPQRHPQAGRAPGRPQVRPDPPPQHRGRRAARRPRQLPLHPRRDPGPGHRHPGHHRATSRSSTAWKRSTRRSSTCTTTSPATAWASASPTAGPAAARSATACWPSAPSSRCSPRPRRIPTPCAWSPTSPRATAHPPWPPSAAAPWPSWTPASS